MLGHLTHLLTRHFPNTTYPNLPLTILTHFFTQTRLYHTLHAPLAIPGHKPSNQAQLRAKITNPQPKSNLNPPKTHYPPRHSLFQPWPPMQEDTDKQRRTLPRQDSRLEGNTRRNPNPPEGKKANDYPVHIAILILFIFY